MLSLVLVTVFLNALVCASENKKHIDIYNNVSSNGAASAVTRNNVASHHNISYIDKAENMLRTPNINKFFEEHKKKKKTKKAPKRTIQKIIKKNKNKLRRVFITRKARVTTLQPKMDYDKIYGPDDKLWKEDTTTTQSNQKKKAKRKYSPKHAGYHMPFQKLQKRDKKDHRHKRGLSRELYILKDLDEMEFMSKEDDKDVVKAHVKNFW